jgi:enoyl-CoA hydratase
LAFGVVNKLAAPGEAKKEAQSLMDTILSRAPVAIRNAVKAVMASDLEGDKGYIEEADLFGELCGTMDFREGIAAFLEKREPKFTGN